MIPFLKTFSAKVMKVEEKQRSVSGQMYDRGLLTQRMEVKYESTGWWIILEGNLAIHVGDERPSLNVGDEIRVTLLQTGE
jgi:mannose-6-phosphate isomerase-like protein (cupin superfamily)